MGSEEEHETQAQIVAELVIASFLVELSCHGCAAGLLDSAPIEQVHKVTQKYHFQLSFCLQKCRL